MENTVETIILDFAKAFDPVKHRILVHKLHQLGLHQDVGLWIEGFLEKNWHSSLLQLMATILLACQSYQGSPGCGVGSTSCLIYVNDLPTVMMSNCRLFADVALIYISKQVLINREN